jgi:cytochrome b
MKSPLRRLPGIPVWDLPVRIFHALLITGFTGAWLTADSEHWRLQHIALGYAVCALVAFRIAWGVVGTQHARFASFVRGPAAVARYLGSLWRRQPEHYTGHNPAGAVAILGLLALAALAGLTGWAAYNDLGGEAMKEAHGVVANLMIALVGVHVLGVVVSSVLHRENLVGAMITGRKRGPGGGSHAHPPR